MKCAMPASRAPAPASRPGLDGLGLLFLEQAERHVRARASAGVSITVAPPTVKASAPIAAPFMKARRSMSAMTFLPRRRQWRRVPAVGRTCGPPGEIEMARDGRHLLERVQIERPMRDQFKRAAACIRERRLGRHRSAMSFFPGQGPRRRRQIPVRRDQGGDRAAHRRSRRRLHGAARAAVGRSRAWSARSCSSIISGRRCSSPATASTCGRIRISGSPPSPICSTARSCTATASAPRCRSGRARSTG